MLRWTWIAFYLILFSTPAQAIEAVLSHSVFYKQDSTEKNIKPYIELYFQINPLSIRFLQKTDSNWIAKIRTDITFSCDTGILFSDHYILETTPLTKALIRRQNIMDLRRYAVPAGKITIQVTLTELIDSSKKIKLRDTFTVQQQLQPGFYSDIELLDTLYPSSVNTIFFKNGNQQIPLCANFYDDYKKNLHFYTELYKANLVLPDEYPLTQSLFISKGENESPVLNLSKKDTVYKVSWQPVIQSFSIAALPSGNYYINAVLENKDGVRLSSKALFFQRFNKNPLLADTSQARKQQIDSAIEKVNVFDIGKAFTAKYTLPQLRSILKMIKPVASPIEVQAIKSFLKQPDEMYMRYYIYNFFHTRNPQHPEQEWKQYTDRVREVNKLFTISGSPGYETDRGYVYLKYGKPTETIQIENEQGALPYILWRYDYVTANTHNYSNAIFLFYRPAEMVADFALLHSTVPGELHNNAWRNYLYVNGTHGDNSNARAEQYLGNH